MPIPDGLYILNLTMELHGVPCLNNIWFRTKETNALAHEHAACDWIAGEFTDVILPVWRAAVSSQMSFVSAVVTCLTPRNLAQTVKAYQGVTGNLGGESMPPHDAALISFFTMFPGRRTHGRLYISGIPRDTVFSGIMTLTQGERVNALASKLLQWFGRNGVTGQFYGVVFSRKNGRTRDEGPPPFFNYSPLAGIPWARTQTKGQIFTQRHRLIGKGM